MVHLHVHSNHSFLEGTATIPQLVARTASHGFEALALTDTRGLYGAIPFYKAAREAGIRPIPGVELEGTVLLARDYKGYTQLCSIVTAFQLEGGFSLEKSIPHEAHFFVLTRDRALITALHKRGLRPLVAVTHYGDAHSRYQAGQLREYAHHVGLRPVAVSPVYFLDPKDRRIQRTLTAIRLNKTLGNLVPGDAAPQGAWFRSPAEMELLYGDWPETLTNTDWVAARCALELEMGNPLFPEFPVPTGETVSSYLWKLAHAGLAKRYTPLTRRARTRLQRELDVINVLGFAPYFLIVWDIVRHARQQGIPIMGRGSAANSLVAHTLGITRVDPLKYDLYFERFLNLSRTDCPDIDLDICWRRRDELIDYVYTTYGAERVAMVCTKTTFRARAAVRETAKAFGLPRDEVDRITRRLPHNSAHDIRTMVRLLPECRGLAIKEEPLKSIVAISERIDGFPRHLSIHAGGLVIAPRPLTRYTPLQRATKGLVITQYDMEPIEELGLIKMDLLGHRSLTVIADTVETVRRNRGITVDVEQLPEKDRLTGEMLRSGRTIGCFQIESPAMRSLLQRTQTDDVPMLIKSIALVRPGASGSGMKKQFIARRHGKEETTYLHPALKEVLGDTYGTMIYQEDVMKVAHAVAGLDLAEADALRRAMGKKRSPEKMAANMKRFVEKAVGNGVEQNVAEKIWALIANFSEYSYCKAHASSYGEVAYQCAYLKAHWPAEFLANVLSNRGGFYGPEVYVQEARRIGVKVRLPDVNKSVYEYTAEGNAIRMGFVEIRNLKHASVEKVLEGRRKGVFRSVEDLWHRGGVPYSDLNVLIRAGACDGFGRTRRELFCELQVLAKACASSNARSANQGILAEGSVQSVIPHLRDLSRKEKLDMEWETFGFLVSAHPLDYYSLSSSTQNSLVSTTAMQDYAGQTVTMAGWLIAERRVGLKGKGCMKFLTLEDSCGVYEAVLFPKVYQRYGHLLHSRGPFWVTGEVQNDHHYHSLIVDSLEQACGE